MIGKEAEFYGAMDGAARFSQRDALATILITAINIVAGFLIGVFQLNIPLADAAEDLYRPHRRRWACHHDSLAARFRRGRHRGDAHLHAKPLWVWSLAANFLANELRYASPPPSCCCWA